MKLSVLLVLISALFVTGLFAQPVDEPVEDTSPDSLPADSLPPDTLETTADTLMVEEPEDTPVEVPVEESSQDSMEVLDFYEESIIPEEPGEVLEAFFQALREGDRDAAGFLISEDGLESIDMILDILKENLDSDEEMTMNRLAAAGYTATVDEIEDWDALDYFQSTVVLPVMKSRYLIYEMEIGEYQESGDELVIPLVFATSSGLQLPFDAELIKEDDGFWRVSSFMGLSSFP